MIRSLLVNAAELASLLVFACGVGAWALAFATPS